MEDSTEKEVVLEDLVEVVVSEETEEVEKCK